MRCCATTTSQKSSVSFGELAETEASNPTPSPPKILRLKDIPFSPRQSESPTNASPPRHSCPFTTEPAPHKNEKARSLIESGPLRLNPEIFTSGSSDGCAGAQRGLNTAILLGFEKRIVAQLPL